MYKWDVLGLYSPYTSHLLTSWDIQAPHGKLLELLVRNVDQVQDSRLAAHEAEVAFQIVPQESQAKPAG